MKISLNMSMSKIKMDLCAIKQRVIKNAFTSIVYSVLFRNKGQTNCKIKKWLN